LGKKVGAVVVGSRGRAAKRTHKYKNKLVSFCFGGGGALWGGGCGGLGWGRM